MKFALLALAAVAAVASIDTATAGKNTHHVRVHVHHTKQDDICYKACPKGQWCARGPEKTCRAPKAGSTECFNYATALWIPKCDPGFKCHEGKCVYAKKSTKKNKKKHHRNQDQMQNQNQYQNTPASTEDEDECPEECEEGFACKEGECMAYALGPAVYQDRADDDCEEECAEGTMCKEGECLAYALGPALYRNSTDDCPEECEEGFTCKEGECLAYALGPAVYQDRADDDCEEECAEGTMCKEGECLAYALGPVVYRDRADEDQNPSQFQNIAASVDACPAECPTGQSCEPGTDKVCRAPEEGECFNVQDAEWVDECPTSFTCKGGKCLEYKISNSGPPQSPIQNQSPIQSQGRKHHKTHKTHKTHKRSNHGRKHKKHHN